MKANSTHLSSKGNRKNLTAKKKKICFQTFSISISVNLVQGQKFSFSQM